MASLKRKSEVKILEALDKFNKDELNDICDENNLCEILEHCSFISSLSSTLPKLNKKRITKSWLHKLKKMDLMMLIKRVIKSIDDNYGSGKENEDCETNVEKNEKDYKIGDERICKMSGNNDEKSHDEKSYIKIGDDEDEKSFKAEKVDKNCEISDKKVEKNCDEIGDWKVEKNCDEKVEKNCDEKVSDEKDEKDKNNNHGIAHLENKKPGKNCEGLEINIECKDHGAYRKKRKLEGDGKFECDEELKEKKLEDNKKSKRKPENLSSRILNLMNDLEVRSVVTVDIYKKSKSEVKREVMEEFKLKKKTAEKISAEIKVGDRLAINISFHSRSEIAHHGEGSVCGGRKCISTFCRVIKTEAKRTAFSFGHMADLLTVELDPFIDGSTEIKWSLGEDSYYSGPPSDGIEFKNEKFIFKFDDHKFTLPFMETGSNLIQLTASYWFDSVAWRAKLESVLVGSPVDEYRNWTPSVYFEIERKL